MNSKAPALSIHNLTAGYKKNVVLHGISLEVAAGEFFGLIGLNGVGKTTLMKLALGLRQSNQGEINIFGHEAGTARAKTNIAYLPERFEPPWFLKGLEFVEFSLGLYGQKLEREKIESAAKSLALDPAALNNKVQSYSKGMRQKLGIIATIYTNCPLVILDEPMSGLDPMARSLVKDVLQERKQSGQTIFFSSHILEDMDEICDRVAILHDGAIKYTGKPSNLKGKTNAKNLERAFLDFVDVA